MIIVTGASRGLGLAICERLLKKGQHVLGLARKVDGLNFPAAPCDVSSYSDIKSIAKKIKQDRASVSAVINAAGIASMNLAITTPPEVVRRIIETNLLGTIYCCQVFSPIMIRQKSGTIINFSTIAVALGLKGESVYVASKAGVEGFSRSFAREMADFNISVNCISPGPIDTDLIKGVASKQINEIVSQQIIGKQFTPESVADLVEMLIDSRGKCLSGQVFHVGGV
jgi:3-oxoacyl-[acyl-carrier protein] reductase